MNHNFIFALLILFCPTIVASQTCFEIHWRNSGSDSGTSAAQRNHPIAFLDLNKNPVYFSIAPGSISYNADGGAAASISRGCADNSFLNVGVNYVNYYYEIENTSYLKGGWFEAVLLMVAGNRRDIICRSLLTAGRPANDSCTSQFSRTLDELNPQLAQRIRDLERELASLQKFTKVEAFKSRFEAAKQLLLQLANIDFENINEADYVLFQKAYGTIFDLKKDITHLKQEIAESQVRIRENLQKTGQTILDELRREGLDDFEIAAPDLKINIEDSQDTSSGDTDDFNTECNIYKTYADKVLDALESLLKSKDRIAFLKDVETWTSTIPSYEKIALNREKFSPKEWDAYKQHYERVSEYIDKHLDKDLWFKDSPVPIEIRQGLKGSIRELAPTETQSLESNLKRLSKKDITPEEQRAVEVVKFLIDVAKKIKNSASKAAEEVQEFRGLVKETAKAVAEGLRCFAQAQLTNRIGSFFELVTGKNQCDGSDLSTTERILSGVELALGTPKIFTAIGSIVGVGKFAKKAEQLGQRVSSSIMDIRSRMSNLGAVIPGTTIPKYFRLKVEGSEFFINPNATKHMGEYINSKPVSHGFPLRNDAILASFEGSVKEAVKSGAWKSSLETGKPIVSEGWELIFAKRPTDELVVVIHALMKK